MKKFNKYHPIAKTIQREGDEEQPGEEEEHLAEEEHSHVSEDEEINNFQ